LAPPRPKPRGTDGAGELGPKPRSNGTAESPVIDAIGDDAEAAGCGAVSPAIVKGSGCGMAKGASIAANIAANPSSDGDVPVCALAGCAWATIEGLATNVTNGGLTRFRQIGSKRRTRIFPRIRRLLPARSAAHEQQKAGHQLPHSGNLCRIAC
jgi:hypothetical protein